ncbi:hypothetical protein [Paenibacillus gorillae]|uniref:hypothetical protein n=1 Tax=Paenibacillus gorillae TaxID=1243662 RepID=UPI0004B3DE26|nr:hypothetical protein [Paenibacillus gorillae]
MDNTTSSIPGAAIRGTASGVIFMAFFGTFWAYTGVMGLQGWGTSLLLSIAIAIGLALFLSASWLISASKKLTNQGSKSDPRVSKMGKKFFFIFAGEGVAIFISSILCNLLGRAELIPGIIAIIVGIHFFPLAPLFQVRLYYVTGALLCLLPILTWLSFSENIIIDGHEVIAYMAIIGLGSALILWATGLAVWLLGKSLLSAAAAQQSNH